MTKGRGGKRDNAGRKPLGDETLSSTIIARVTPEQKETINKIVKNLKDYNIKLLYDYFINDYGLLDSKFFSINESISIDDFLTNYKFVKKFKLI